MLRIVEFDVWEEAPFACPQSDAPERSELVKLAMPTDDKRFPSLRALFTLHSTDVACAHNWFHIDSKSMNEKKEGELKQTWAHVARIENSSCEPGKKNVMRKGCGKKLHLTHWLRATSEVKHFFFSVLLFVYYLRGVVFFIVSIFFRLLSAIFNFSHFSFFLRHRSQLKRFFSPSTSSSSHFIARDFFSDNNSSVLQFQLFCERCARKKTSEKCELKTNEIWSLNSIGMRWNFHQHGKKHRLTFLKWNSAEDDDNIEEEMNCISWFVERLKVD